MALDIHQIPVLSDNYVYLVHEPEKNLTAVVDPAVSEPVLKAAAGKGWKITHILNTHHHYDHVGGNLDIKDATGCTIVGPSYDQGRIPGIDIPLKEGETFRFGNAKADIFFVPGHTKGHIAYWFKDDKALFCGDTLFAMGCGRLFEGTPEQMWKSLQKLKDLPDDTKVYCAHEYTKDNGNFALTVDPENTDLKKRMEKVRKMRDEGKPTIPALMKDEKKTNPFLRPDSDGIREALKMKNSETADVFAEVRKRKDCF